MNKMELHRSPFTFSPDLFPSRTTPKDLSPVNDVFYVEGEIPDLGDNKKYVIISKDRYDFLYGRLQRPQFQTKIFFCISYLISFATILFSNPYDLKSVDIFGIYLVFLLFSLFGATVLTIIYYVALLQFSHYYEITPMKRLTFAAIILLPPILAVLGVYAL